MNFTKIKNIGAVFSLLVLIGSGFFVPLSQINSAFAADLGTIQVTVNPANSVPIDNELNAMIVAVLDGDTYLNDPGEYIPDENFTGTQERKFTINNVPLNGTNTYTVAVAFFKEQQRSVDYTLYTIAANGTMLAPGTQSGSFVSNVAGTRSGNTVSYEINIARSNPTISLTATPPSLTNQSSVTIAGGTRKNSSVTVTGGAVTANTTANSSGVFSLNVTLNQNAANALQIKATDTAGAESNIISANVTHDNTPPVITLSGTDPQTVEAGSAYIELGATAVDAREGNINASISTNSSFVNTNAIGSYSVTYSVSDSAGNSASKTRTVSVTDTIKPVITLTGVNPQIIEVGSAYTEFGATATDSFEGNLTGRISINTTAVNTNTLGSYTVRYNVSDSSGNTAVEKTRTVNVVDTTKPVITLAGANPQTIQVGSPYTEFGATASDNYNGNISANIIVNSSSVNVNTVGTYAVAYNVSDSSGNTATQKTRTVSVVDTVKPVVTLIGADTVTTEAGLPYTDAGATASDNYDGNITARIVIANPVDTSALGTYTIHYNVADASGNIALEKTRTVRVTDTISPIITRNESATVTIEAGSVYVDAGATALDSFAGNLTANIVVTNPVSANTVGIYTVRYNVSDSSGNAAPEVTRTVNVEDTTPPSAPVVSAPTSPINANSALITGTAETGSTITITGGAATATGVAAGGNFSISVNLTQDATNTISITATDVSGNTSPAATASIIEDSINPVITIIGANPASIEFGATYTDAGRTVTDNVGISEPTSVTSNVNTNALGAYTVEYSATDIAGNSASATRVVNVVDTTAPVISLIGSSTVTAEAGLPYVDAGATAEDSFEGPLTPTATSTVDTNTLGTYTVTYGISDSSGNQANEVVRTVNVQDTIAPDAPTVSPLSSVINVIGTLTFSGTAEPGSLVILSKEEEGGPEGVLGTDTADVLGNFSIDAPLAEDSVNILKFQAVDASNNNSSVTTLTITEDSTSPGAPGATPATGTFNTAQGVMLAISADATAVRTFYTTDGTEPNESSFEYIGTPIAIDGAHGTSKTLHAISIDEAGNQSATTETYTFDKEGPVAPIADIASGFFNIDQNVTLTLAGDADGTFYTLDGTSPDATSIAYAPASQIAILGEDGETVTLRVISFDAVGNASDIVTKTYSFDFTNPTVTGVSDGDTKKTVTFFFNEGEARLDGSDPMPSGTTVNTEGVYALVVTDSAGNQTTVNFEIDRTAPVPPPITTPNQTVNANSIAIEGTAEANSIITITGGLTTATGTATGGNFSVSVNLTQNATNTLSVKATDIAGNISSSSVIVIIEDSTPPATPLLAEIPSPINADTVTIVGAAEVGSIIWVYKETEMASGTADTAGNFSVLVTLTQNATNTLSVTATDAYGNVSLSSSLVIVEDSTAPAAPTITTLSQTINANFITVEGTAEANSLITITGGLATATGTATGGSFSISVSLTQDVVNTLSLTATDTVDNESSAATVPITEDSTAPNAPTITTSPQTINANSLLITGTAEANASIEITGGAATATGTANGLGNYLISVLLAEDATNTLSITARDAAGNVSSSSVIVIVEDSTPPAAPVITIAPQTVNADSITVEGTAEANATMNITGGASPVTGTVDENGNFAIEVSLTQNAANNLSVTASDALENESLPSSIIIVEDSTPPAAPIITTAPQTVNADSIAIEGTAEAGATITITGGQATATGTATGGSFSISVNLTQNATNTLSVTATDAYSNVSLLSSLVIVEDSISPNAPIITTPSQVVNASTKTINGTAEAGTLITATGGFEIATSTVTTGGSFSIAVKLKQDEANMLSLTATDAAGNESSADTVTITEDSIAPAAPTVTTPPQITNADSITIEGSAEPEAYILIAIYGGAETVSDRAEIDGSFAIDVPLTQDALNHLLVTAADAVGNTSPTTPVDITEDSTPPVIALIGDNPQSVEVGSLYTELGATAEDSLEGDLTEDIVIDANAVNTNTIGSYAVTYDVSDSTGNTIQVTRTVNVVDITPPVITLTGGDQTIEVGSAYTELGATASDNYDGNISASIVIDANAVNVNVPGSYSVTYNASDSSGNAATEAIRTVNVVDTTAPVLTLIGDNPQIIEGGDPYVELGATASDNYDGDITADILITISSVNTGVVGIYEAIYEVSDSSGNTASATRTIEVVDTTAPVITLIGESAITHEAGTPYADAGATAEDVVDGILTSSIAISNNVNVNAVGTYSVTYSVTDLSLNTATATRTVDVVDTIKPVITITGSSTITLEFGSVYIDEGATASDTLEGNITSRIATSSNVNTNALGVFTVTYNVSDNAGNSADEVARTINVVDTTKPIITITGSSTIDIEFASEYVDAGATATDNVDDDATITNAIVMTSTVNTGALGTYSVTYGVSDSSGNAADEVVRTVNVVDTTIPVITINGGSTVTTEAGVSYADAGATATDNVDDDTTITNAIVATSTVDTNTLGYYTVTYGVSDSSGNNATSAVRIVLVRDTIAPIITLVGSSTVTTEFGLPYVDAGATAEDSFEGPLTPTATSTVDTNTLGTYTVTYGISDSSGNQANEVVRTVNVTDTIAPDAPILTTTSTTTNADSITVTGTAEANSTITITGGLATATGTATGGSFSISVNLTQDAANTLLVTATDASENTSIPSKLVIVEDSTEPVITITGNNPETIEVGSVYVDAGATALDSVAGELTSQITTSLNVNTAVLGEYAVTYNVSDTAENLASSSRIVNVVDITAPVIALIGSSTVTIEVGSTYVDAGATASDNYDLDITANITSSSDVNATLLGTYSVIFSVSDSSGNTASTTRVVEVIDTTPPVLTLTGDNPQTIEGGDAYTELGATAIDNVDNDISANIVITTSSINTSVVGTYEAVYEVSDSSGNTASATRTIEVVDTTAPVITLIGESAITHEAGTPYADAGATATDNVDNGTTITNAIIATNTVNTNVIGDYAVTYNVSDSSGNPAVEIVRTVQVRDTIAPVLTLVGNSSVTAERGSIYVDAGATANDSFEADLTESIAIVDPVDTDTPGTYTIRYNVSDSSGNTASEVTREVVVADTIIPTIVLEGVSPQIIEFGDSYIELGATANDTYDGNITANIVIDTSAVNTNALGSYTVRYNVTDSSGNAANEVTRAVEVLDTTAPAGLSIDPVATPTNVTPQIIAGTKEANSSVILNGNEIVAIDEGTAWSYNLNLAEGENAISLTSKDALENESTPVVSNITLDTETPAVLGVTDGASYSGNVTPTFSDNREIANATLNGLQFPSGTEVTDEDAYELIVTDTAGNTTTVRFTLDFTMPGTPAVNAVTTPTNVTPQIIIGTKDANTGIWINGTEIIAPDELTAWNTSVSLVEGSNELNVTAKDNAGNESSPSIAVIVLDTTGPTAPTANIPEGNYNGAISITLTLAPDASGTFFVVNDGEPTVTSTEYAGGTIGINGTDGQTKTLKAVSFDALGNRGGTMSINYTFDKSAPTVTPNGSSTVSIEQGRTYTDEGATALDTEDGNLTTNITTSTTLNNLVIGTYTFTYSVTDSAGNTGSAVRTIEVIGDVTAPELTMLGDNPFTLEQGVTYTDAGATATDLVDGSITGSIVITNPVNIDIPATYTITYAIEDAAGNSTSTTRTVVVNPDATPPVIALVGNASVEAAGGSVYNDAGATASDIIDGVLTDNIITTNPVNTGAGGTYTVRYNVEDTRGNQANEVTREVVVANDTTAPVITILGENPVGIEIGDVYFDAGASASDAVNGVVSVTAVSTVNTQITGPYTVTYTARDVSGNMATAVRTVNVTADVTPPVITLIGGKTINIIASSTYVDAGATALDNIQGNITTDIVPLNTVNANVVGTYTVTYDVTDAAGNEAIEAVRTVHVVAEGADVTLPVITLTGSSTITIAQGDAYTELGATASDNTDGDITANIITSSTVDTNVLGEYRMTYNVTDTAGNTAEEKVRIVRVVDVTAPVITLIGNSSVNIKKLSAYTDAGATASDNTDGDISAHITSTSTVNTATAGVYAVTYNVSDAAGNAAVPAVRTVNVNELSTPVLANLTPTNSPLFLLASSTVQMTVDISDADDERVSYNAEINSSDPDTNHWPTLTKFTPFEPTVGLNNFNAIGAVKFTIQTREFWNNATLTITARDRDGNETAITRSVRTRP